jgi:DNA-binding MarR family transcriptional regulator
MILSDDERAVWRLFLEAHSLVARVLDDELMTEQGFPLTWYDVLVQLSEADRDLRMAELAERLLLSRSATTRFVDRLEEAGLVERRRSAEDGRGFELHLTEHGMATLEAAAPGHIRGVEEHFARHFDDEEAEVLRRVFERIVSVARGLRAGGQGLGAGSADPVA